VNALLLAALSAATSWADRGRAAVVLVILVTLILVVARWAANRDIDLANEEDQTLERNSHAPQWPANRLNPQSRQIS
jgi:hypothetical protein